MGDGKTVIEIIENEKNPNRMEIQVSKQFVKMYGSQSAFVSKPNDLSFLEPGIGKDLMASILKKFKRNSTFKHIFITAADPSMGGGITAVSPEKITLSFYKMTPTTKGKLIEAFANVFGSKTSRTIKERIVFEK